MSALFYYYDRIQKKCKVCGKEFIANGSRAEYCSEECRKGDKRMVKYKIEKMTEVFPRVQGKMEEARKKIDLPDREADILLKIVYTAKNAWDVCRVIWGEALSWEDVKEYAKLWYLWNETYAYRDSEAYFVQTVEPVEDEEIDGWHEEQIFYIIERYDDPEWWGQEYSVIKISPLFPNLYSYSVRDEKEYKKIIDMFPEFFGKKDIK